MFKYTPFSPKTSQKAPQGPFGTPQDDKNYLFEMPGYENPMVGKRIFELSPVEKKVSMTVPIGFLGPGAMSAKRSVCR